MVYHPCKHPHWQPVNLKYGNDIENGGTLLYQSVHMLNGQCGEMDSKVCRLHDSLAIVYPGQPYPPVPLHYCLLATCPNKIQDVSNSCNTLDTDTDSLYSTDESDDGFKTRDSYYKNKRGDVGYYLF